MGWKDTVQKEPQGSWKDTIQAEEASPELGAGVRGVLQGASGGFSDELAGAFEAGGKAIGLKGVGGPLKDISVDKEGPSLDWEILRDAYKKSRDHYRDQLKHDKDDSPWIAGAGNLVGAAVSPINKLVGGMSAVKSGLALGGLGAAGLSEADNVGDLAKDTATGAVLGGTIGKVADLASPLFKGASNYIGNGLKNKAEGLAVNATGATGLQASKFSDDAGRQLLDRGLVKFGDNAANIAERTQGAMDEAHQALDQTLKALDAKGVTASADNVVAGLSKKIAELEKDPSQAGVVRKLNGIIEDITQTGESNIPLSMGEQTKRGFSKMAGNWQDPEVGQAGKQAYLGYRDEVENAAKAADPELASKFTDAKETHGLLAPIQEAAEKRGMTQGQSPMGGLGDMAAGAVGGFKGVVAKKLLAPRISSSMAVTADQISQKLLSSPEMLNLAKSNPQAFQGIVSRLEQRSGMMSQPSFGAAAQEAPSDQKQDDQASLIQKTSNTKYNQVLQNAAQKGPAAFNAAHYVLSQRDSSYRKILDDKGGK